MASTIEIHYDPKPKNPFARGAGPYQPEAGPRGIMPEPGGRVWDRETCTWMRPTQIVDWGCKGPLGPRMAVAVNSGGQSWQVVDTRTGVVLWKFTAGNFQLALIEKRRLCQQMDWRSGWGYLKSTG